MLRVQQAGLIEGPGIIRVGRGGGTLDAGNPPGKRITQTLHTACCTGTEENARALQTIDFIAVLQAQRLCVSGQGVDLVENQNLWHVLGTDLAQNRLHLLDLFGKIGVGRVHNVQQQIGVHRLLQRRLKGVNQAVRQIPDKTHRI